MKILYCIDSLMSSGGTERVLTSKVNWLAQNSNHQVSVVSLNEAGQPFFKLDSSVQRIIIDDSIINKRTYKSALLKIIETEQPDVMIAVAGLAVETLPLLRDKSAKILEFHYTKNFLVNFVKGIHNIRFRNLHLLKMRYLQWKLARQACKYDCFVGLTKKDVNLWGNPSNMTFIHNPLSFKSDKKSNCLNKKIIAVGSWTPAKGMDQLLEAFGPISTHYPDWKVELYGSGQDEALLKSIINNYRMERQVSLNAPVQNISEKLTEASIYAFPSRSDGFGLVITEAMECGLPTVAMDCECGPCEIVTENTGIVVKDKDIESFRNALTKLMDSPDMRQTLGRNASIEVKRFYPENIMPQWEQLLLNLCIRKL